MRKPPRSAFLSHSCSPASLTGQLGVRNTDASYLDDWSSHFYSVGPSLSIPLFQGAGWFPA